ncbi:MAG: hypothetical protein AAGG01_19455 [Planctomycetota bacterium]
MEPPAWTPPPIESVGRADEARRVRERAEADERRRQREERDRQQGLNFAAIGVPLALVMGLTPLLQMMGWFLRSLVHEFGHTVVGIFCGFFAIPKIALSGHAMTSIGDSHWTIRLAVVLGAASLARTFLERRPQVIALGAFTVLYVLTFLEPVRFSLILLGGLSFEVVGGAVCLWRCLHGEACHSDAERAAYGMLGWFFSGRIILLGFGLAFRESVRIEYLSNGSFGLTNDLVRFSSEVAGAPLGACGFVLGAIGAAVPAVLLWRFLRAGP